jgi:hypothetical protein
MYRPNTALLEFFIDNPHAVFLVAQTTIKTVTRPAIDFDVFRLDVGGVVYSENLVNERERVRTLFVQKQGR